jgi:hypothetical protein
VTHRKINPTGVVPRGPVIDYTSPQNRAAYVASRAERDQEKMAGTLADHAV